MLHFQVQGLLMKAMSNHKLIKNLQGKNKFLKVWTNQIKIKFYKKIWLLKKLKFQEQIMQSYKLRINLIHKKL